LTTQPASTLVPAQPLILLVGMHRSGTSLAASLLQTLGVGLPGPWPLADIHNPEGYYEQLAIRDLQEQLLLELHRMWPTAAGTLPLPEHWLDTPSVLRAERRLEGMLRQESCRQPAPWAIKDPRTSLLLPLWRRVADRLGMELRLVQALREPAAVVQSLVQRDGPLAGMTPLRAQQLWWHHHHRIHVDGQGLDCLTIRYEEWFTPRAGDQLQALATFCLPGEADPTRHGAALGRIRPELRHDQSAYQDLQPPIPEPIQRVYERLASGEAFPTASTPSGSDPAEPPLRLASMPEHCCLAVVGAQAGHWVVHAWLNRCPFPPAVRFGVEPGAVRLTLHLQPLALSRAQGRLAELRAQAIVLDPTLNGVEQLRAEGVKAFWIDPQAPSSGWLESYFSADRCAQRLGLPHPDGLAREGQVLCLGSLGAEEDRQLGPPVWGLPGFDRLLVADVDEARLLASWLNRCNRLGLQLVRLGSTAVERHGRVWSALDQPLGPSHSAWLPTPMLEPPLERAELEEELAWRRAGCPQDPCIAPTPEASILWQWPAAAAAAPTIEAAVCISLYNYGQRIETALESVRHQTLRPLELIVVDDGSEDDGVERVRAWLERHGRELGRAVLLAHGRNGGLAATRNTAFAAATAPWCLVLDADNALEPEALRLCLGVARSCPASTAVVHPLIELRGEEGINGHQGGSALLEGIAWQAAAFVERNTIDAMALIRRQSWQQVGGYAHIPGGWEDFDLWCRFVEAGLHGVICPQRLAIYHRHRDSMIANISQARFRMLKRLMQQRHHWLQFLPQPT
jgi:GT2 family glycosyltransferase